MLSKVVVAVFIVCITFCSITTTVLADNRWNVKISGEDGGVTKLSYPPSLNAQQGQRWTIASPTSKAYLASLYDIPIETAVLYGAKYMKYPTGARWHRISQDNISDCYCK